MRGRFNPLDRRGKKAARRPARRFDATPACITICDLSPDEMWRFGSMQAFEATNINCRKPLQCNELQIPIYRRLQLGMGSALGKDSHNTWSNEQPMSIAPQPVQQTNDELPQEIVELSSILNQLPIEVRSTLEPLVTRVVESTRRRRRILNLVQDALGQLRLDMKYLVFDLEATRRERDELRQKLDGA
jgi:hypothetical protein